MRGSFSNNFMQQFWKRVDNLKEIVNIQVLFVLTLGYVDMATYPLTKYYYITESIFYFYVVYTIHQYIVILAIFIYSIVEV